MPASVTRTLGKVSLGLKKHSPEILVVAGVVGTVTSAVLACKATTKLSGILEEAKDNIDMIHECAEHPETLNAEYTEEDAKKDLAIVYVQTGIKVVKLYAPAVILGGLSIAGILTSNNILRKRNVALAAAYATVDKGFKEYRGRVVERFGEELDKELRYNIKAKEIEETVVDEKGKEKTVKKSVNVIDPNAIGDFAKFFDDGNTGWDPDPELSLFFLKQQQAHANDILQSRGHLFLNEVYDMLGIPRTAAGSVVGWVYDPNNPDHKGDNFVDFGIYNQDNERVRAFVNGQEKVILLDFNPDGQITSTLPKI